MFNPLILLSLYKLPANSSSFPLPSCLLSLVGATYLGKNVRYRLLCGLQRPCLGLVGISFGLGEGSRRLSCILYMFCSFSVSFFSTIILYSFSAHLRASHSVCSTIRLLRALSSLSLNVSRDEQTVSVFHRPHRKELCPNVKE